MIIPKYGKPGFYSFCRSIFSIVFSSSRLKWVFLKDWRASLTCSGLLAPINTEVTRGSFKSQASAICAKVWFLWTARSFNFLILSSFSGVTWFSCKNPCGLAARESEGIPFRYLSVSNPCAKGENGMHQTPCLSIRSRRLSSSTHRSNIEYLGW